MKKHWLFISWVVSIITIFTMAGINYQRPSVTAPVGKVVFTIGTASAAGTADYTCSGVRDDITIQTALNALPNVGGELVILAGNYNFGATVSRTINNVTIEGMGSSTYFAYNATNAIFSAGAQAGWTFRDFSTDAGGITYLGSTLYLLENVKIGTSYISFLSTQSIANPTGRGATYVVAASDATAKSKAQADFICDGVADEVQIQAAIDALPAGSAIPNIAGGGRIQLTEGIFHISNPIWINKMCVEFDGVGQGWSASGFNDVWAWGTTCIKTDSNVIDAIWLGDNTKIGIRGIKLTDLTISGSGINNGKFAIGTPAASLSKIDSPIISDISVDHFQTAISMCSDTAYIDRCQLLVCTNGIIFHFNADSSYSCPLNSVNQSMMGDIVGIGVQGTVRVVNCSFWGSDSAHQMAIGAYDCELVVGCHFGGGNGAEPLIGASNCRNITGCIFNNCIVGIEMLSSSTPSVISGNVIKDCHTLGMALYSSTGLSVTGNSISGTVSYQGIGCSQLLNTLIESNHFINNALEGVYLGGACNNVTVKGNTLEGNGGTVIGGDGSQVNCTMKDNTGFNPVGLIANPIGGGVIGLVGSGTAVTTAVAYTINNTDCFITSTGGTVSNIVIKDVGGHIMLTGVTTLINQFVPIGYSITWTHAGAPTVTVFGN